MQQAVTVPVWSPYCQWTKAGLNIAVCSVYISVQHWWNDTDRERHLSQ